MRRAIISRPWRCPTTRCAQRVGSLRTASTSFLTIRPTGMPVQSATTAATAWASTLGRISGASPWSAAERGAAARGSSAQPRLRGHGGLLGLGVVHGAGGAARGCGRPAPAPRSSAASSPPAASSRRRAWPRRRSRRAAVEPRRFLAADDLELGLERLDRGGGSPPPPAAWRAGSPPRGRTPCRAGSPPCRAAGGPGCNGATASPPPPAPRPGAGPGGASRAWRPRRAA